MQDAAESVDRPFSLDGGRCCRISEIGVTAARFLEALFALGDRLRQRNRMRRELPAQCLIDEIGADGHHYGSFVPPGMAGAAAKLLCQP